MQNPLKTSSWKIDIIGIALLALLGVIACNLACPLTPGSIITLCLIAYAMFRIVFELTWNRHKVPTLATGLIARHKMAALLRRAAASNGKTSYKIVDLGSGRGQLARYIARTVPNSHVTGIEIAPLPHRQAEFIRRLFGPTNVSFQCLDFNSYDCSTTDAVVMYLSSGLTRYVGQKLWRELPTGSTVIAHTFPLAGPWVPVETATFRTPFTETLFVYRKP